MTHQQPLWTPTPDAIAKAPMTAFREEANRRFGLKLGDYSQLHQWSVESREDFWQLVWDWCGVIGEPGSRVLENGDRMPGAR